MSHQDKENKLQNIISDLEILSQKCARDIQADLEINADDYLVEFNRILDEAKLQQPNRLGNIQSLSRRGSGLQNERFNQLKRLYDVDHATTKLLARLKPRREHKGKEEVLTNLEQIFKRFQSVARQLRDRRESRSTLDVKDEYDVQDLLHALLQIFYDDIRPEEWTPSYAGSASRMDFLLKEQQVVVEVKKTRDDLRDKQIGNQLIEDIARYGEHPDCRTLVCFVYDPEALIANPTGLENDLRKLSTDRLDVRVYITPR